jgi:hypothetical protein
MTQISEICAYCGREWIQHWNNKSGQRFCSGSIGSKEFSSTGSFRDPIEASQAKQGNTLIKEIESKTAFIDKQLTKAWPELSQIGRYAEREARHQEIMDFFNDPTPMERPDLLSLMDEEELYEDISSLTAAYTKVIMMHAVTQYELETERTAHQHALLDLEEARKDVDGLRAGHADQARKLSKRLDTIESQGDKIEELRSKIKALEEQAPLISEKQK